MSNPPPPQPPYQGPPPGPPPAGPPGPKPRPWYLRWWAIVGAVVLVVIVVVGSVQSALDDVASDTASPSAPAASESASNDEEQPTEDQPADNCVQITPEFAQSILDGAPEGTTLKAIGDGYAVESHDNPGNYFVAIKFSQGGEEMGVGVWQAVNLDSGPFRSVDAFSKEFTQWPDSGNAGAPIVGETKDCIVS